MDWGCHGFSATAGSKCREFVVDLHKKNPKRNLSGFYLHTYTNAVYFCITEC
jgi:hypothetical protein